jgi:hypothetical protein
MKLPNASTAFVDIRKLSEYVLDENSPRGRHKARVFRSALGITVVDADALAELILTAIIHAECVTAERDFYGQRYTADCKIVFKGREAVVRTGWIVRQRENFPRLTTCFVLRGE